MYGYIAGYSDTNVINYCPACGARIAITHGDGTGSCDECGMRFGVVEIEDESEE